MENIKKTYLGRLIEFIKDYRLSISPSKRISGIGDTLIGWGLIAINVVFFSPPIDLILSEINFIIVFLSGCLSIFFYTIYRHIFKGDVLEGLKDLLIRNDTDSHIDEIHLTPKQRKHWIYFRGILATTGYIAFDISKIYFGNIDNSEIFGADALVYALLAFLILHKTFSFKEIMGIIIASLGVSWVLLLDIKSFNWSDGLISGIAGIASAIAMTVIFFVTGIIVRHDSPKRVAFHQCVAGLIVAILVLVLTLIIEIINDDLSLPQISSHFAKKSIISGILYATSLVFFLRAFLRTEPIVIAVVGYSLGIFVILLEWLFKNEWIGLKDSISAILIGLGCFLLIHEEYMKDKKKTKESKSLKPVYEKGLKDELSSLKKRFVSGELDRYSYLSEKHEFNKLLLEYSSQLKDTLIECIKIFPDSVIFKFKSPINLELETDGGACSAPFEILNFGNYEIEDETMAYKLIKNGDTILDIGAHIGWYTINFANKFPQSKIYAFEPVKITYEFLKKNVARNGIENAFIYNIGCADRDEEKFLYYFQSGSAIASIENLIEHKNAKKIKCSFKTIDHIVENLKIKSVEFIKCDAEGSELLILKGAEKVITTFKPIIFAELYEDWCQKCGYSTKNIVELVKRWEYKIYQAKNDILTEISYEKLEDDIKYNYFFLNERKHKSLIEKISK